MYLNIFSWVFVVVAVVGTVLVTRRHPAGYYFWAVSNAGLTAINLDNGATAQAAMFAVYLVLSIYGISQERRRNRWRTSPGEYWW